MLFSFCSQEKKMLRKASTAVDQSEFDKALGYYDQILYKDEKSFFGNAGKGIVLSEYMSRHEQAIPYLEKALANSPPDKSKPIIHGNLGRSYHFIGNYKRALEHFGKLDNDPSYSDYDEFLSKRIADCKYALEHPEVAIPENQAITNVGNTINTDKPEYTPVYTNGKLFFTSKRQDNEKEKKNGIDGKYFESVYIAEMGSDGNWTQPKKVDLGETAGMQSSKYGEAVASASPDGKNLYIYKGGKIFQTGVEDPDHKMEALDDAINFSKLQNHAALSPDGNTMYFTSESDKGRGGSDIYYSEKKSDGSWGEPQALDFTINTPYDEEAPFVNESGVLFFSSNGHPGYGGFDIYRTQKVNGAWTKPVNLGQPVNSPGDDIFFSLLPNSSKGYFASARAGGFGDLDIYRVHYVITDMPECKPAQEIFTLRTEQDETNPMVYNISLDVPENEKNNIRSYSWAINGKALAETKGSFTHTFNKPDEYVVTAKVVALCDTCPALKALCTEKTLAVNNNVLAANEKNSGSSKNNTKGSFAKNETGKNSAADKKNNTARETESRSDKKGKDGGNNLTSNDKKAGEQFATDEGNYSGSSPEARNRLKNKSSASNKSMHLLSDNELNAMNWNTKAIQFDYNNSEVSSDTRAVLDKNIDVLRANKDLKVEITGHADSRGSSEYNKTLSKKRAQSVKKYLVSKGVSSDRIKSVKGAGEEELVNECSDGVECDEKKHAENRRVKIEVHGPDVKNDKDFTSN